jgi:hypothetical protein
VYSSRSARNGDDPNSLCNCGKMHLTGIKGQQFLCLKKESSE